MNLTKELYHFIETECDKFECKTGYDVDVNDVVYSYLFSDNETFRILNDWDEGEGSDPFWNHELDGHSGPEHLNVEWVNEEDKTALIFLGDETYAHIKWSVEFPEGTYSVEEITDVEKALCEWGISDEEKAELQPKIQEFINAEFDALVDKEELARHFYGTDPMDYND